jgi:hypothetical protein
VVSPVEHLTRLAGTVLARWPHERLPDRDVVLLDVDSAEVVLGPDLLSQRIGQEVEVTVRRELLGAAGPGARLSVRAHLTPVGVVAESHPPPGELLIAEAGPGQGGPGIG